MLVLNRVDQPLDLRLGKYTFLNGKPIIDNLARNRARIRHVHDFTVRHKNPVFLPPVTE